MIQEDNIQNIPYGCKCVGKNGTCPFFELVKMDKTEWKAYKKTYSVPAGAKQAQYCNYSKAYLLNPTMTKDCGIHMEEDKNE